MVCPVDDLIASANKNFEEMGAHKVRLKVYDRSFGILHGAACDWLATYDRTEDARRSSDVAEDRRLSRSTRTAAWLAVIIGVVTLIIAGLTLAVTIGR